MLLSWKTCHGAYTLHGEEVCVFVPQCFFPLIPLCGSICRCVCVSLRENLCNLMAYPSKQAGFAFSSAVLII